jgi:predicted  nucleic acid-binding Zn-ribbon protein
MSLEEQYAEAKRLLDDVLRRKERIQSGLPEFEEKPEKPIEEESQTDRSEELIKEVQESLQTVSELVKELKNAEDPTLLKLTKLISDLNAKLASEIDAQARQRELERQVLEDIDQYLRRWG